MTQDPYRLNDDDLQLSADNGMDSGDEYDGLDMNASEKRGGSKLPVLLGVLVLLVAVGGGFFAYQNFMVDSGPIMPPGALTMPPGSPMANNQPPVDPAMLPPGANPADMNQPPMDPNAVPPLAPATNPADAANAAAPPAPGANPADDTMPPAADATAANAPVDPNALPPAADTAALPASPDEAALKDANTPEAEKPADAKTADAATQDTGTPPAVNEAVNEDAVKADVKPADAAAPVEAAKETAKEVATAPEVPKPNASSLTPIDPKKTMENATKDVNAKTANTIKAVNDILGQDVAKAAGVPAAMPPAAPVAPAEITPRAREVIIVKKSYSAQSPQAIVAAGDRVLDSGEYRSAVDIYNKQLATNPSDPMALAGKAVALQKSGNTAEAMATYDRLLSLNPRDVEALTNYLGLLQEQKPEQALSRLQTLAAQYPDNAAVSGQMGMAYARLMDTPNALRYFQRASALDQQNPTYPFNMGVLYDRLGTASKASEAYGTALRLARENPERAGGIPVDTIRARMANLSE